MAEVAAVVVMILCFILRWYTRLDLVDFVDICFVTLLAPMASIIKLDKVAIDSEHGVKVLDVLLMV